MTPAEYERLSGQKLAPLHTALPKGVKGTKYKNRRVQWNGLWFDSQKEARRAQELTLMQQAGLITELELDKRKLRYDLVVNGVKVGRYTADSRYRDAQGVLIIEDVKSAPTRTAWYQRAKKLLMACYGIRISEID